MCLYCTQSLLPCSLGRPESRETVATAAQIGPALGLAGPAGCRAPQAKRILSCPKGSEVGTSTGSHLLTATWGQVQDQLLSWAPKGHAPGSSGPRLDLLEGGLGVMVPPAKRLA